MKLRHLLFFSLVALAAPRAAHAETFAFVDTSRVYAESSSAKRVAAEVQGDAETKRHQIDVANAAVKKAEDNCYHGHHLSDGVVNLDPPCKPADAARAKADAVTKAAEQDFAKHQAEATAALRKHIGEVAAKLAADRHVTILPVTPLYPAAGRDLTDELVRRLNAADIQATADENAQLKAKLAALEAAAKAKPPSVPPVASVARK